MQSQPFFCGLIIKQCNCIPGCKRRYSTITTLANGKSNCRIEERSCSSAQHVDRWSGLSGAAAAQLDPASQLTCRCVRFVQLNGRLSITPKWEHSSNNDQFAFYSRTLWYNMAAVRTKPLTSQHKPFNFPHYTAAQCSLSSVYPVCVLELHLFQLLVCEKTELYFNQKCRKRLWITRKARLAFKQQFSNVIWYQKLSKRCAMISPVCALHYGSYKNVTFTEKNRSDNVRITLLCAQANQSPHRKMPMDEEHQ